MEPERPVGPPEVASTSEPPLCDDVVRGVLERLDRACLVACSAACRRWSTLASSPELWERLFVDDFCSSGRPSRLSSNEMGGTAHALKPAPADAQIAQARRLLGRGKGPPDAEWKHLYRRRLEVERNWARGEGSSRTLKGHNDLVRCAQLDGDVLVTSCGSWDHADCSLRVWDVATGELLQLLQGHMGPIWCMAHDASESRIVSGSDDYTVRYWDSQTGNCVVLQDPDSSVRCVQMDPEGSIVVAGTEFGRLLLWDRHELEGMMSDGMERVQQEYERLRPSSPGGSTSSTGGAPSSGGSSGQDLTSGEGGPAPPNRWGLGPGSTRILVDGTSHVQGMEAQEGEGNAVSAIQVQGGLCASTSMEGLSPVRLWDVRSPQAGWRLLRTVGDPGMMFCHSMSFETATSRLVAGCGDRNVRVWDLETGALMHLLQGHTGDIHAHQFDETTLVSAGLNGQTLVWDMRTGKLVRELLHGVNMHAFQYRGQRLASGTWDGRVMLWDLGSGRRVREWDTHTERVWALCMDDYRIVSAALDRNVCVRVFTPQDDRFQDWGTNGL